MILACLLVSHAQEVCVPISYISRANNTKTVKPVTCIRTLPFWDDFSNLDSTTSMWTIKHVYVNRHYTLSHLTIGVATFDGLNAYGHPHNPVVGSWGPADTLVSCFINLSGKSPADSVYLYFRVQAGGLGDKPAPEDSLILLVRDSIDGWIPLWKTAYSPYWDTFRIVAIPLNRVSLLHDSFQLMFINYATLSGNNDHWHVDLVYIDDNRTATDTSLSDVAIQSFFIYPAYPYTVLPWRYLSSYYVDTGWLAIHNLNNTVQNTTYRFMILYGNTILYQSSPLSLNIPPGTGAIVKIQLPPALPSLISPDSTIILKPVFTITASQNFLTSNDSITHQWLFGGLLAYDDGTPEMAYGLLGAGTAFAYRYDIPQPDTLWGFAITFIPHNSDVTQYLFSICVWQELTSPKVSDNIIARRDFLTPCVIDSAGYGYFNTCVYLFDQPVVVPSTFYAGWIQTTSDPLLVGIDMGTDASAFAFFNNGSAWFNSSVRGAVLFRPVIGSRQEAAPWLERSITGLANYLHEDSSGCRRVIKVAYPHSWSHMVLPAQYAAKSIYSLAGALVYSGYGYPSLPPGVYVLVLDLCQVRNYSIVKGWK